MRGEGRYGASDSQPRIVLTMCRTEAERRLRKQIRRGPELLAETRKAKGAAEARRENVSYGVTGFHVAPTRPRALYLPGYGLVW